MARFVELPAFKGRPLLLNVDAVAYATPHQKGTTIYLLVHEAREGGAGGPETIFIEEEYPEVCRKLKG